LCSTASMATNSMIRCLDAHFVHYVFEK